MLHLALFEDVSGGSKAMVIRELLAPRPPERLST